MRTYAHSRQKYIYCTFYKLRLPSSPLLPLRFLRLFSSLRRFFSFLRRFFSFLRRLLFLSALLSLLLLLLLSLLLLRLLLLSFPSITPLAST